MTRNSAVGMVNMNQSLPYIVCVCAIISILGHIRRLTMRSVTFIVVTISILYNCSTCIMLLFTCLYISHLLSVIVYSVMNLIDCFDACVVVCSKSAVASRSSTCVSQTSL